MEREGFIEYSDWEIQLLDPITYSPSEVWINLRDLSYIRRCLSL